MMECQLPSNVKDNQLSTTYVLHNDNIVDKLQHALHRSMIINFVRYLRVGSSHQNQNECTDRSAAQWDEARKVGDKAGIPVLSLLDNTVNIIVPKGNVTVPVGQGGAAKYPGLESRGRSVEEETNRAGAHWRVTSPRTCSPSGRGLYGLRSAPFTISARY